MRFLILFILTFLLASCDKAVIKTNEDNKVNAESFFRGIYGCDPSVVKKLASDSIIISYPIFERLYNKVAFHGQEEAKNFAEGFCSRWKKAQIIIHDSIEEDNKVILVWSFKGTFVGQSIENGPATNSEHSWGGISLFQFNDNGKIISEVGEESDPGPHHRLNVK